MYGSNQLIKSNCWCFTRCSYFPPEMFSWLVKEVRPEVIRVTKKGMQWPDKRSGQQWNPEGTSNVKVYFSHTFIFAVPVNWMAAKQTQTWTAQTTWRSSQTGSKVFSVTNPCQFYIVWFFLTLPEHCLYIKFKLVVRATAARGAVNHRLELCRLEPIGLQQTFIWRQSNGVRRWHTGPTKPETERGKLHCAHVVFIVLCSLCPERISKTYSQKCLLLLQMVGALLCFSLYSCLAQLMQGTKKEYNDL